MKTQYPVVICLSIGDPSQSALQYPDIWDVIYLCILDLVLEPF